MPPDATAPPTGVVVVGAPRSGTSLLARLLVDAGLHAGRTLIPASEHNPTGFFEDIEVNRVLDDLLAPVVEGASVAGAVTPPRHLSWLCAIDPRRARWPGGDHVDRLRALVPDEPFLVKDPRLSYTLPVVDGAFGPAVVLAVVRHPGAVAASIRAMVDREPSTFARFDPGEQRVWAMWRAMYASIERFPRPVHWVHHEHLLDGSALPTLAALTGLPVIGEAVEPRLVRSERWRVPADLDARHRELLRRCADDRHPSG